MALYPLSEREEAYAFRNMTDTPTACGVFVPGPLCDGTPLRTGDRIIYYALRGVTVVGFVAGWIGDRPVMRITGRRAARFGWRTGSLWEPNMLHTGRRK